MPEFCFTYNIGHIVANKKQGHFYAQNWDFYEKIQKNLVKIGQNQDAM